MPLTATQNCVLTVGFALNDPNGVQQRFSGGGSKYYTAENRQELSFALRCFTGNQRDDRFRGDCLAMGEPDVRFAVLSAKV
jgi:hypothetical protein